MSACIHTNDRMAGYGVHLACELRYPEVMDDVGRLDADQDIPADRNVDLVRGERAARVASLPPPLVARHDDVRLAIVRRIGDPHGLRRAHEEAHDDSEGDECPCNLEPCAARDLGGFASAPPCPESHDTIPHEPRHDGADDGANDEGLGEQPGNGLRLG